MFITCTIYSQEWGKAEQTDLQLNRLNDDHFKLV